jgi:hypothetical protein
MQNGCLRIPYYQQFVEFPRHQITNNSKITNSPYGLEKYFLISPPEALKIYP